MPNIRLLINTTKKKTKLVDSYKTKGLRKKLAKELQTLGIKDPLVLKAIEKIPRHYFLDTAFTQHAYKNKAFPIGDGQTISHPHTVAFQTELLELKSTDKVLEIGTGSGYQTTVLSEICHDIFTIERIEKLSVKAQKICKSLNVNATFIVGDGTLGLNKEAPFDKIIVTAGAPTENEELIKQLNIGGILVIPIGDDTKQNIVQLKKISTNRIKRTEYDGFAFVPLIGKNGW